MEISSICVYCGSSDKVDGVYLKAAREMGASIAGRGHTLVYGGGSTGLMGAVADSVLAAGGEVTGVITEQFNTPQLAHGRLTRMEVLPSMHERKARMAALADAFVVLPGGFGTMEEFFEALTWAQIGLHAKPVGLLNTNGYYRPLLAFLEHVVENGFAYAQHGRLYSSTNAPDELLDQLNGYQPPDGMQAWVERDQ
jgi:hypothetical protein